MDNDSFILVNEVESEAAKVKISDRVKKKKKSSSTNKRINRIEQALMNFNNGLSVLTKNIGSTNNNLLLLQEGINKSNAKAHESLVANKSVVRTSNFLLTQVDDLKVSIEEKLSAMDSKINESKKNNFALSAKIEEWIKASLAQSKKMESAQPANVFSCNICLKNVSCGRDIIFTKCGFAVCHLCYLKSYSNVFYDFSDMVLCTIDEDTFVGSPDPVKAFNDIYKCRFCNALSVEHCTGSLTDLKKAGESVLLEKKINLFTGDRISKYRESIVTMEATLNMFTNWWKTNPSFSIQPASPQNHQSD